MHMLPLQHSLSVSMFFSGLRLLIKSLNGDIIRFSPLSVHYSAIVPCVVDTTVGGINGRSRLSLIQLLH